ncbi:LacI family DNA-binding transcriptional regulator [Aureimonas sp. AU20]|uniref:LacI family DNA-binding transcriptional regulator n=1 Tax=Aureimonas sp. AU20 TaxID=1349819 RepID=UPI0007206CBA|nr:LacI family DNA-binding transcriptional regulator [Aureimonas sp. AU20]ALN75206.1 hypothetical protein M673_20955 [Aureimonas sp. AU20]
MRIQELAKHLNISIGTVSRALNGKPDVNPETRKRVMEAARALGYQPNQSGRSLRKGSTGIVAFVTEVGPQTSDENAAFFMMLHQGVQSVTAPAGLDYLVLMCPDDGDRAAFMNRIVGRKLADGFILSATKRTDPRIEILETRGIPFVSLGRSLSGRAYDWIDLDFHGLAASSVRLLAAAGHKRIAITVPMDDANLGTIYLDGYRQALTESGLPFDEQLVIPAPVHGGGGHVAAQALMALDPRPTAILLVNDLMAEGLYATLREGGLEPGRDIGVVGHRAIQQNAHLKPALTSFRMSVFELGQALGSRLLLQLPAVGRRPETFRDHLWPFEMVVGESHG